MDCDRNFTSLESSPCTEMMTFYVQFFKFDFSNVIV